MPPIVNDVCWRIGGQQGEGIDSTGDIFAKTCARMGLRIHTYRSFSSRIRGGLTYSDVRVSAAPVHARSDRIDYVLALGQEVVDASIAEASDGAVLLYDKDAFEPKMDEEDKKRFRLVGVPMTKIAEQNGSRIMKNMVALGATGALLHMPLDYFYGFIDERFGKKGEKIVSMNRNVVKAATDYIHENFPKQDPWILEPRPLAGGRRLVTTGNSALSYGALVGGTRFVAGYPITPATEVMEWFIDHVDEYGGVVVQSEDELAAINLILGSNYAGVRALTSTSGPGLCLMTEAIGLGGMAEIPLLVVDVMRPGPSTGLPTKHSQADLMFAIHGGHDDYPRIVVSPSTIEEAFYYAGESLNWAEEYQCPVFLLIDQDLAITQEALDGLDPGKIRIRRGKLLTNEQAASTVPGEYKRFEDAPDGISPRALPGMKGVLYLSSGSEHEEHGIITENRANRNRMMEKRARKMRTFRERALRAPVPGLDHAAWGRVYGPAGARFGVITWGSTIGPVEEAIRRFEASEGEKVKRMVLNVPWPFPREEVKAFLDSVERVAVIESNFSGMMATLVQQEVGGHDKIRRVTKYDGIPFRPVEIVEQLKEAF